MHSRYPQASSRSFGIGDFSCERRNLNVNEKIAQGTVKTAGGTLVSETLEEALVSKDGKKLYPVKNGIPILLADEAIAL